MLSTPRFERDSCLTSAGCGVWVRELSPVRIQLQLILPNNAQKVANETKHPNLDMLL